MQKNLNVSSWIGLNIPRGDPNPKSFPIEQCRKISVLLQRVFGSEVGSALLTFKGEYYFQAPSKGQGELVQFLRQKGLTWDWFQRDSSEQSWKEILVPCPGIEPG